MNNLTGDSLEGYHFILCLTLCSAQYSMTGHVEKI